MDCAAQSCCTGTGTFEPPFAGPEHVMNRWGKRVCISVALGDVTCFSCSNETVIQYAPSFHT